MSLVRILSGDRVILVCLLLLLLLLLLFFLYNVSLMTLKEVDTKSWGLLPPSVKFASTLKKADIVRFYM